MDKKTKSPPTSFFSQKNIVILITIVVVVCLVGVGFYFKKTKQAVAPAPKISTPTVFSFSRMKRDTIYFIRPGDQLKIKDETPNTTRAISFTPALATTYKMTYFPDKKKWIYTIPKDAKEGDYTITVITTDKTTKKVVKTKETPIEITKNGAPNKDILDTD